MLAILFANLIAPLIDYAVVKANVRRRLRRQSARGQGAFASKNAPAPSPGGDVAVARVAAKADPEPGE